MPAENDLEPDAGVGAVLVASADYDLARLEPADAAVVGEPGELGLGDAGQRAVRSQAFDDFGGWCESSRSRPSVSTRALRNEGVNLPHRRGSGPAKRAGFHHSGAISSSVGKYVR
jgi:hypothetical protein